MLQCRVGVSSLVGVAVFLCAYVCVESRAPAPCVRGLGLGSFELLSPRPRLSFSLYVVMEIARVYAKVGTYASSSHITTCSYICSINKVHLQSRRMHGRDESCGVSSRLCLDAVRYSLSASAEGMDGRGRDSAASPSRESVDADLHDARPSAVQVLAYSDA